MASSSVRWYGPQVSREIREQMRRRMYRAARAIAARARRNVSRQGPPHSIPGEFPHRVSGELQDSIHVETDARSLTFRIVADAPHAQFVEAERPFLRRTLREMRSELRAIILGPAGGSGRYKFTE